ncbi:hypothetical protein [Litorihabitans aurantiacus]|uniref:hypothetical protein n=1 Tax=Litorihabitans aurantiacus TaxID=1930061 RepID=UPI0024E1325B|nr:hypothetical protein [Litorihabitans aurantiacus]
MPALAPASPVAILGTGAHRPGVVVTSDELDAAHGRRPGESRARSGVEVRRWARSEETSSSWRPRRSLGRSRRQD